MHFHIGEINIICTDIQRSLHFYHEVIGFALVEEEGDAYHLRAGEAAILLLPAASGVAPDGPYCSYATFSIDLVVEDAREAARYLREQGVFFERDWEPNQVNFFIRDPDGLVLEVIESA